MENKDEISQKTETPFNRYMYFGMPRISTSIVLTIVDFAVLFIYFEGYQLNPLLVGIALMCGKFAIAISQSTMGWLSDKTKTRFGRRKPFMIIGAPILGVSFILLLLPTYFLGKTPNEMSLFAWLLIFAVLFQFFYGELTTPYQSWMAEQFEVHERSTAAAWQNIYNYIGAAIALLFTQVIVPNVMESYVITKEIHPLYSTLVILFVIVTIALFYVSAYAIPVEKAVIIKSSLIEDFKEIIRDKNFIHVCMFVGISSLTWGMITGVMLGYVQKVLLLTDILIGAGALAIGVLGSLFAWKKIISKIGKKKSLMIILAWAACTLPFGAIIPLLPFTDFTIPAVVLVLIIASALGGWFLFPYIVYADLAENDEKSGEGDELKAGLYTGFPSILLNIFQAFGLLLVGALLLLPPPPGKLYSFGYLLWAPLGSVILVIAFFYLKKYVTLDFEWEKDVKR
jgi:GPH family glycoside/pentoside/hexuronide:cation symporter